MSTYSETFEDKVRNWICTKYQRVYTGPLTYTVSFEDDNTTLYSLSWGLNHEMYPFVMQGQFSDEDSFYDYVVKQIAITKFYETKRFIAKRLNPPEFIDPDFVDPLLIFDKQHINT